MLWLARNRYFVSAPFDASLNTMPHSSRRSCKKQQQKKMPRAQQYTFESCDAMRSRKAQCQAPPDNPETGDTSITAEKDETALAKIV